MFGLLYVAMLLTPAHIKAISFESRRNFFLILFLFIYFSPGVDASRVYVPAWALGYFHSLIISIFISVLENREFPVV